jgi:hypothetical protein
MTDAAEAALANITRRMGIECQSYDMQNWSVTTQRQAILLSGREITKLSMAEAHEAQMFERTLQTAEQREAASRQGYQRLLNLEAATALVASITMDEVEAFLREVEACQQD